MKEVIPCAQCANAALKPHFGFAGTNDLYCSDRSGTVDPEDGCTFGARGQPAVAIAQYEIDLGDNAAVCG